MACSHPGRPEFDRHGAADAAFRHRGAEAPIICRWPPRAGRLTAVAMTEPASGSDVASMKTKRGAGRRELGAERRQDATSPSAAWRIGSWCLRAPARAAASTASAAFMVDTKTPGFTVGKKERKMGHPRRAERANCSSTTCAFPTENMIGEEGQASRPACVSSTSTGRPWRQHRSASARARSMQAVAYARERKAVRPSDLRESRACSSCSPTWQMQTRGGARPALRMHPTGRHGRLQPAFDEGLDGQMLRQRRRHEGDDGRGADFRRRRLHAAISRSSAIMRDAKINQIFEGTNQIQRLVISRHMLREGSLMSKLKMPFSTRARRSSRTA